MKRLLIAVSAIGLLATACSNRDDGRTGAPEAANNQADIAFVQAMIPHHEQAVTMSGYASTRGASP